MAALVTTKDVSDFLGVDADEEWISVAWDLADQVEALLLAQCGRTGRPFKTSESARVEVQDGTGRPTLYLDYSVKVLTAVKLGYDVALPDETLVVSDPKRLVYQVGSPRLVRTDGGVFGCKGKPNYVRVTYDTQDDVPEDAGLAVLRGVAVVWGQRGSEDASAQHVGGFGADLVAAIASDPIWRMVVGAHRFVVA